jgi:thermitase
MPIRVSNEDGYVTWSTMAKALTYGADKGARVANMSFNGVAGSSSVLSAAKYFKDKGGLVVVSAGNSGKEEAIAASNTMITVSATDKYDARTSWSSYGKYVDVAAPGAGIYTTNRGGSYGSWNGTSFSSPVTAGVVALMFAANSKLTPADVEKLLFSTTVDLGAAGYDIEYGWGRVDAYAAVQAALETSSGADIPRPPARRSPTRSAAAPSAAWCRWTCPPATTPASRASTCTSTAARSRATARHRSPSRGTPPRRPTAPSASARSRSTRRAMPGTAQTVYVNVSNETTPPPDTQAPVASISSPTGGSTVSGQVTVGVSATDDTGVARVDLYVNGSKVGSDSSSPFSFSWDTTKVANGTASLQAVAVDAAGNAGQSATVSVMVSNTTTTTTTTDTTPPVVAITSPATAPRSRAGR